MSFTPTEEQQAIVKAATDTDNNLLVNALAGAAKTSTLVLMAEALKSSSILCLAFNKKIQVEMQERLPHNCTAMTLNSYGYRAWSSFLRRRMEVNARKNYFLVKDYIDGLEEDELKQDLWDQYDDISTIISGAKTAGFIPDSTVAGLGVKFTPLMDDAEFLDWCDIEMTDELWDLTVTVLTRNIEQGLTGRIDYDDMIYLSTLCKSVSFQRWPVIMIDEAQDLSALNHQMLYKMSGGTSRIIAVGDPCQAIYGFRGAHENSMSLLKEQFDMEEFTLSISFRCPKAVVREARWRAPNMKWPEWAIDGKVSDLRKWGAEDIPEQAAVICRNNAPLFGLAMRLLRDGRYPEIQGDQLSKRMIKVFKSFGGMDMPAENVETSIELWLEREKEKRKDHEKLYDFAACLRIFVEDSANLGQCIKKIEEVFSKSGPIKLMTGHKSKGLEFTNVFIMDRGLIRAEKENQEANLLYVMQTRAMETLTYVDSRDYVAEDITAVEGSLI